MDVRKLKTNMFIIILLVVIAGGYAFFFLSPRIFSVDESNLKFTPLSEKVTINNEHSFSIEAWQYSPKEAKMGIVVSLDSTAADPSEKYVYQLICRNKVKNKTTLNFDVTYQSNMFATLMVYNVPQDFSEAAISVGFVDKHLDERAMSGKEESPTAEFATAFTNKKVVDIADGVEQLNVIELYIGSINKQNEALEKSIKELEGEVANLQTQQQDILIAVAQLRNSEAYLTESEMESVNTRINNYQRTYDTCSETINKHTDEIQKKQKALNNNQLKLKELEKINGGETK